MKKTSRTRLSNPLIVRLANAAARLTIEERLRLAEAIQKRVEADKLLLDQQPPLPFDYQAVEPTP